MLIELFNQCLAKNDSRFSCSFCRQHLKPASFTATKGREKDALHLKDLLELPRLSRNDLLRIFTADSEFSISDSVLLEDLFAITGESALMISLIAKLYKKTRETTSEESPSVPLETILHQLEYPNNHMDEKSVLVFRHKHEYTGYDKTLDMIGHIKSVCKKSLKFVDPAAKDYMKWLCCFGAYPLSLDFVSRLIPDYQESCLETLHGMGLVDITDGMLKISPLISFAVFADQNPKPKQKEFAGIFNNLTYFLRTYEETLSVPYLSNALLALVNTLYKKIPFQHNPGQKTVAEQFENWQELIALIYNYYHQYGDYYAAEKAASSINYPDLISKHSYFC